MIRYEELLSTRAMDIKPSGIRKFFDMLEEMKDVVALTVGQPDFPTPWHVREAGIASLEKDVKLLYTAFDEAKRTVAEDPDLSLEENQPLAQTLKARLYKRGNLLV